MEAEKQSKSFKFLSDFTKRFDQLFSIIDLDNYQYFLSPKFFFEKTKTEFQYSIFTANQENIIDIVFKTKSEFYIYLSKSDPLDNYYNVKILYEPEKRNEVIFFIKTLKKQI
jgi:hypothetical protein